MSPEVPDGCGKLDFEAPGGTPRTYLDATFCSIGPGGARLDRLLTVDRELALSVMVSQVPYGHTLLVLVNSSKYGGSGGPGVATCSSHLDFARTVIHELGHSAFGLADEYGGDGTGTPLSEPGEPNVTLDTTRHGHKWGRFIGDQTPMPSACSPTRGPDACTSGSTCIPPATAPANDEVGTYEGAIYSNCNAYRPSPTCCMRDHSAFCKVCDDAIRRVLAPFQPPPPVIGPPGGVVAEVLIDPRNWLPQTAWDSEGPAYLPNPPWSGSPQYTWVRGKTRGIFAYNVVLPVSTLPGRGKIYIIALMSSTEYRELPAGEPRYSDVELIVNGMNWGTQTAVSLYEETDLGWSIPTDSMVAGDQGNLMEFRVGYGRNVNGLIIHYEPLAPSNHLKPIRVTVWRGN